MSIQEETITLTVIRCMVAKTVIQNYNTGNYDKTAFSDNLGFKSEKEAFEISEKNLKFLKSDVLLHGDYCLPNVMLDNWKFSGFIDLDHAGVGDRHVDIFWAAWSLRYNLKTDAYTDRFFDAYGRERIDPLALRTVAAAEVFG